MTLALPLAEVQGSQKRSQEHLHGLASEEVLVGKRVVIAEDDGITSLQLERMLKRAGMLVVGMANNGQKAVEVVLQEHPDIVLMDIRMPLLDGFQAAERILAEFHPCIVFVTAFTHYQEQARQIDACGYLIKPVNSQNLLPFLQNAYADWQRR